MLEYLQDETSLVRQAIAGDAQAFGSLYSLHQEAIYRYICARVGNINDAEDLTEQVFLKAWEALSGYEQRDSRFTSWLYRIAHNIVIDHYRVQTRTIPASLLETGCWDAKEPTTLDKIVADEEIAALTQAVEQLPEDQKRVIMLRFVEGLNHAQIADILDKSKGACRIIQHRALTALNLMLNSTLSMILAMLLLLGGTILASARALPGNTLYPVKRSVESLELAVFLNPTEAVRLRLAFADRRVDEASALLHQQQTAQIDGVLGDYRQQYRAIQALLNAASGVSTEDKAIIAHMVIAAQTDDALRLIHLRDIAPVSVHATLNAALETSQAAHDLAQQELDAQEDELLRPTPSPMVPTLTPTLQPTAIPSGSLIDNLEATQIPVDAFIQTPSPAALVVLPQATVQNSPAQGSTATPWPAGSVPSVALPTPTAIQVALAPSSVALSTPLPSETPIAPSPIRTSTSTASLPVVTPTLTPTILSPTPLPTDTATVPAPTPLPVDTATPTRPTSTSTASSTSIQSSPTTTPTAPTPSATPTALPTSTPQRAPVQEFPESRSTTTPTPSASPEPSDNVNRDPAVSPTSSSTSIPTGDRPLIEVEQTASQSTLMANEKLTFTIRLRNPGASELSVMAIDKLPARVDYVAGSATPDGFYIPGEAHSLFWDEIVIPANSETVISFQVRAQTVTEQTRVVNIVLLMIDSDADSEEIELGPLPITILPSS